MPHKWEMMSLSLRPAIVCPSGAEFPATGTRKPSRRAAAKARGSQTPLGALCADCLLPPGSWRQTRGRDAAGGPREHRDVAPGDRRQGVLVNDRPCFPVRAPGTRLCFRVSPGGSVVAPSHLECWCRALGRDLPCFRPLAPACDSLC